MATSGTIKSNTITVTGDPVYLEFAWSTTSQTISSNTSSVYWTVKAKGMKYSNSWFNFYNTKITVNGNVYSVANGTRVYNNGALASGTTNIVHNSNGTKTFSVSIASSASYASGTNLSISGSGDLNQIPRTPPTVKVEGVTVINEKNQSLLKDPHYAVQNVHKVKIIPNATAHDSSTIVGYKVTFQGQTYTGTNITVPVTKSGTLPIYVIATDSNGMSSVSTKIATIESRAYSNPKLSVQAKRTTSGVDDPLGLDVVIGGTVTVKEVKNKDNVNINKPYWTLSVEGVEWQKNTISYKKTGVPIETEQTWTLTYKDIFNTFTYKIKTPTGQAPFVIGKQSIGVNVIPPSGSSGAWIKDGLVNGYTVAKDLGSVYADYTVVGSGNHIKAIQNKWPDIPEGVSIGYATVGSRAMFMVYKYPGGTNGMAFIMPYNGHPKSYYYSSGSFKEVGK